MNIFISGKGWFGASVLEMVSKLGLKVVGVSAPFRDDKQDRLHFAAERLGTVIIKAGTLTADKLPHETDLIIAAHSHDFLGRKTRLKSRLGAIGYHPSLLPRHRGRDAVRWTIKMGDAISGGSVYWLTDTVDGGPIAAQQHVFVKSDDTPEELWRRELAPLGIKLLRKVLSDIHSGLLVQQPQDPDVATWEPSIDGAPRLFRPELELLGSLPSGFKVVRRL